MGYAERAYPGRGFPEGRNPGGFFQEVENRERLFEYVAFWTGCRVWADLVAVHSRRSESGKVFPRGRILGGVVTGSRNPGRYTPEIRIRVWDLEKRPNLDLSLLNSIECSGSSGHRTDRRISIMHAAGRHTVDADDVKAAAVALALDLMPVLVRGTAA